MLQLIAAPLSLAELLWSCTGEWPLGTLRTSGDCRVTIAIGAVNQKGLGNERSCENHDVIRHAVDLGLPEPPVLYFPGDILDGQQVIESCSEF
jgi:hypothetical protein